MDLGKVAVYQGGSVPGNVRENLAVVRDIAEDARRLEAHTVVFPELFLAGYDIGADQLRATAVAIDDAPIREARALALEKAINIVLPFAERRGNQARLLGAPFPLHAQPTDHRSRGSLWMRHPGARVPPDFQRGCGDRPHRRDPHRVPQGTYRLRRSSVDGATTGWLGLTDSTPCGPSSSRPRVAVPPVVGVRA